MKINGDFNTSPVAQELSRAIQHLLIVQIWSSRAPRSSFPLFASKNYLHTEMSSLHIGRSTLTMASRRCFSTSHIRPNQQYHFDTFKFVERLEKADFTRQQSESIMKALRKVMGESMTELTKPMVTKAEQEKVFLS